MKTKSIVALSLTLVIILYSCGSDNYFFNDNKDNCINSFVIPDYDSVKTNSYFKGEICNQSVNIYDDGENFTFYSWSVTSFTSLPGEEINPKSDSLNGEIGMSLIFMQNIKEGFPTYFSLETPLYNKNTSLIEIIDNISIKESLLIGDDRNKINGYTFGWHINCEQYNLSPIYFATGVEWLWDYYYDQSGKWIKVINFSKEINNLGQWEYNITFDINVNIFTVKGYYGEVKGTFKTNFVLSE